MHEPETPSGLEEMSASLGHLRGELERFDDPAIAAVFARLLEHLEGLRQGLADLEHLAKEHLASLSGDRSP